jgi:nicotinamidase-related amidase
MRTVHGKQVCETLDEVLDPARAVLVVIDVQNDAMRREGKLALAGNNVDDMVAVLPRIAAFAEEARALAIPIIHVQMIHKVHSLAQSGPHLRTMDTISAIEDAFLEGTWGAELCEEVAPLEGEPIVVKHRSSAFRGTDLDMILRATGRETVVVVGEQTPGCVEATFRDAAYHDYYNVLIEDCVAAYDRRQHDASLLIQRRRHDVCLAEDALAIWRAARERDGAPLTVAAGA